MILSICDFLVVVCCFGVFFRKERVDVFKVGKLLMEGKVCRILKIVYKFGNCIVIELRLVFFIVFVYEML